MTDYDELSYLRRLAREQDAKLKAYKHFIDSMDKVGVMLINPLEKRDVILQHFLQSKRELNLNTKQK